MKKASRERGLKPRQRSAALRLESVRQQRQPFVRLAQRLIASDFERYLPAEGSIVEIGMGDGQLRERLPEAVLPRVIHTEPDAAVSRTYRRQHRNLNVIQAAAERLPFESGSLAAVIGSCVLDVVPDGPAVAREVSRVLKPGGRLLHWLDMSTMLSTVVESLWSVGVVPLPNWFSDPSGGEWPHDLFLMPREQLALIVGSLQRAASPAALPLGQYLATFSAPPEVPGAPTQELIQLQESPELRSALSDSFKLAFELATPQVRARLADFHGRTLSMAEHFELELRRWFDERTGFRVELSRVERAWETTPLQAPELVYRSCLVGEQRHLSRVPDTLLCAGATSDPPRETLVELGIFSFVATRLSG